MNSFSGFTSNESFFSGSTPWSHKNLDLLLGNQVWKMAAKGIISASELVHKLCVTSYHSESIEMYLRNFYSRYII